MSVAAKILGSMLLVSGTAPVWAAPAVPAPQEFYFDSDAAAVPMIVVQSDGDALVAQLLKQRERGRRTVEATVQLASVAIAQGRTELGEQLYREALKDAPVQGSLGRSVRWNYGWDLLRQAMNWALFRIWENGKFTDLWLRYFPISPF